MIYVFHPSTQIHIARPSISHSDPAPEPPSAKWVWKNAVEQHTFFRLTQPDPPSRIQTLLRRGSKFRYSGRTLRQTQKAKLDRPDHNFTRYACLSALASFPGLPQLQFSHQAFSFLFRTLEAGRNEASLSHNRTLCYIFYY